MPQCIISIQGDITITEQTLLHQRIVATTLGESLANPSNAREQAVGALAINLADICKYNDGNTARIMKLEESFPIDDRMVNPYDDFFQASFQVAARGILDRNKNVRSFTPEGKPITVGEATVGVLHRLIIGSRVHGADTENMRKIIRNTLKQEIRIDSTWGDGNTGARKEIELLQEIMRKGGFGVLRSRIFTSYGLGL